MQCIRCGSKDHSTREHDEGKIGGAASPNVKRAKSPGASHRLPSASIDRGSPGPHSPSRNLALKAKSLQPEMCWKSVGRCPGIPEILDPPFRERGDDGQCLTLQSRLPGALKVKCPCKTCQKKAEKEALNALRRQGKA
jgi:hypothetical protein